MEEYQVKYLRDNREGEAGFIVEHLPDNRIFLRIEAAGEHSETDDYGCLHAFNYLREYRFPKIKFLCNGARKNFVQSGMMEQSGGFYGYLVTLGRKPDPNQAGFIFDFCPPSQVSSVEEQKLFKKLWYESLVDLSD